MMRATISGEAAQYSDKVALSCAVPSSTPEYNFFYPFRSGSVGGSQQSFPTLRHLQPKSPVVLVGSQRGKASTLIDLFFEKICFVEHCHNQKARSEAPQQRNVCALLIVPAKSEKKATCHEARRIAVNFARLLELLKSQPHWR
jgi:hypothetical protein